MGRVRRLPEPKISDPFQYHVEYTAWMWFKLIMGIILLLPIRAVVTLICLPCMILCVHLSGRGWKPGQHLKPWQKFLMTTVCPRISRVWMFGGFGFYTITVKGERASASEAPIAVIAPHSNVIDAWMLGTYVWGSILSRKENEKIPGLGTCIKACEPIWVEREGAHASTVREMQNRLNSPGNWIPIVLFPEGTVHRAEGLIGFKTGAFRPGVPVQPVMFKYRQPSPGFWGDFGHRLPMIFLLVMCAWRNCCEIEYLPVYTPSAAEEKDANLYARNVRDYMAKAWGVAATDYSYEDLLLMKASAQAGLPLEAPLIEYNLFNRLFGVRLPELKTILSRFVRINAGKRGVVGRDEFLSYLQWPVAEHAGLLFDEYDTCSGCGELRFREYVLGTLDLAVKVPDELIAEAAFEALSGGEARMSADGVLEALRRLGHAQVTKAGVEAFLYRVSEGQDLSEAGFSAHLAANPDLKVLAFWLLNGTDHF